VPSSLDEILRPRFEKLGVAATRLAWAAHLDGLDKGTLSRILNGSMPLTADRALKWAHLLLPDESPEVPEAFASRLLEAAQQAIQPLTVTEFFEDMLARGGAVSAERIKELFKALQLPGITRVLICCEYRDLPRAAPDARYEYLAKSVGQAIAAGISFAMFQPFGEEIPLPLDEQPDRPALNAALYMMQIKTKCIDAYKLFRNQAMMSLEKRDEDGLEKPATLNILKKEGEKIIEHEEQIDVLRERINTSSNENYSSNDILISSRLQLYERSKAGKAHLGSGFQSRMFYIRYTTEGVNHARIMQWVSTPNKDLLIYRGQNEIMPDALKDSFYPIPHFFDSPVGRIPSRIDDSDDGGPGVRNYLKQRPGGEGLPVVKGWEGPPVVEDAISVWKPYD
jgi:hypothetical protein